MNEDLDYSFTQTSSVLSEEKTSNADTNNLPVLKTALKQLADLKASYRTVDKLNLDDKHFTVEQQLSNNKQIISIIVNLELLIKEKVKELGDV